MRILKRIVYTTTIANRVPEGTEVVPMFPDIHEYAKSITCHHKEYEELLKCYEEKIVIPAYTSSMASPEIGYIIEHNNRCYAVPKPYVKSFMHAHDVVKTDESPIGITIAASKNGIVIMGNSSVTQDSDTIAYVYDTDYNNMVETRIPVCKSFYVKKKNSIQCITPKGLAVIPGVKLLNEDILGVVRGEVIDVSWNDKYRHK